MAQAQAGAIIEMLQLTDSDRTGYPLLPPFQRRLSFPILG